MQVVTLIKSPKLLFQKVQRIYARVDLSLIRGSWDLNMETSNINKNDISTKKELDTLKKSEAVTNDDKYSKIMAPKTLLHVTSTPAKASEQRSRLSPTHHKDKTKPFTSVAVANQLLQPEGSAKAGLVVSISPKEFKRTPPNQAGPLERNKAFRILKRLATNPIREDQMSSWITKKSKKT